MSRWLTQEVDDGVVHVTPLDDLTAHNFDEDCACGPTFELVDNDTGPDGHLYVHHSLDGREASEGKSDE